MAAAARVSRLAIGDPSIGLDRARLPRARRPLAGRARRRPAARHARRHHRRHTFPLDAEYDLQVGQAGGARLGGPPAPAHAPTISTWRSTARGSRCKAARRDATAHSGRSAHDRRGARRADAHGAAPTGSFTSTPARPGITQVTIAGPLQRDRPRRHAEPSSSVSSARPRRRPKKQACAAKILTTLATRAYRRPVPTSGAEMKTLLEFYAAGRKAGTFESGIQRAVSRVLVDPQFLFRFEREPADVAAGAAFRLSDLELASRLSFFLWSSIPDDELLDAARRGTLKDPAALERQVRRMLADPRAEALVTNFAGQWLFLRELKNARPDSPDFDGNLRQSFQRETELLFRTIVQEDRSVIDFLERRLHVRGRAAGRALRHPDVHGSRMRRVTSCRQQSTPRAARPRQHPDDHVGGQPHVAGRARQVGAREPARRAAAAAAARRRDESGEGPRAGQGDLASPAARAAPRQPGVRVVPSADGSDRPHARELRPHRQVAHGRRPDRDRRLRPADRRHEAQWPAVAARRAARALGRLRHRRRREDADLCLRPGDAAGRHAGGPFDRARRVERQLSFLVARARRGRNRRSSRCARNRRRRGGS